jgi:hypothetical protein
MTNGKRPFVEGNPKSKWGRRFLDIQSILIVDLGGVERLSEYRRGLIGTAATLQCEIERMQGDLSLDREVDGKELTRLAGAYRRTCEALGLSAKPGKNSSGARGLGSLLADDLDKQREAGK